ncbi:cell wall glycoprotein, partial [Fusarium austroafricanum]
MRLLELLLALAQPLVYTDGVSDPRCKTTLGPLSLKDVPTSTRYEGVSIAYQTETICHPTTKIVTPNVTTTTTTETTTSTITGTAAEVCAMKCNSAFDECKSVPDANNAACDAAYAQCLGYNPFESGSFNSPTACSGTAISDGISATTTTVT